MSNRTIVYTQFNTLRLRNRVEIGYEIRFPQSTRELRDRRYEEKLPRQFKLVFYSKSFSKLRNTKLTF